MTGEPGLGAAAAKGGAITLGIQAVRIVINLSTIIILARMLAPEDFGLVAMVVAIVGIAEIIRDFGLSNAALQAANLSQAQKTNLFWINTSLGAFCSVTICLAASTIAALYGDARLEQIAYALSGIFLLNGMTTQFRVEINRRLEFAKLGATDLIPQVMALMIAIVVAQLGGTYWAIVAQQLTISLTALLVSIFYARWMPGCPSLRTGNVRDLVAFGLNLSGTQVLAYFARNADSFLIGRFIGPTALGLYDRAFQLLMAPINQINAPLTRVAVPILARVRESPEKLRQYLQYAQLVSGYVTASLFLFVAGLSEALILLLFGEKWLPAAGILSILALGGVFRSLMQVTYWIFLSTGNARAQFRLDTIAQPLIVVSLVIGVSFGLTGVAVAHSIAYAIYWSAGLWWAGHVTGLRTKLLLINALRIVAWIGVPIGLIAAAVNQININPALRIGTGILLCMIWCLLAVAISRSVREDAQVFRRAYSVVKGTR
ncbi:lipopolysaccharide biosynthesis protein [Rhodococcus sp. LW-XY12]|uniref:lipopolysaccharide biosynthesis protein n=1 Tax=Rhodococcus sp. LW-XY12 TaxID=2856851 RepID=UPI001C56AD66|nr:lipopolysaccharide biosynthesis protein [Rhodococcus sp. LW-XY12]QXU53015.1 lipopolysaccharide biosynthesis protein [Rhodococcus sp. LW-XY12]